MFHISLLYVGNTKIMPVEPLSLGDRESHCWRGMWRILEKA